MNIKEWSPEMCIAHLTLRGWQPAVKAIRNRGLRNGIYSSENHRFLYEWGMAIESVPHEDPDALRSGIEQDYGEGSFRVFAEWFRFSVADLRKMVQTIEGVVAWR